jgi:hypothetical protein
MIEMQKALLVIGNHSRSDIVLTPITGLVILLRDLQPKPPGTIAWE